jgi:hypothetical protein
MMPLGYQQRFRYGKVMRSSGMHATAGPWLVTGRPLIEYDALFTYRSGSRAKQLSQSGNVYKSLVRTGSLADQLRRRNEYLQMQIRDELTPTTGTSGAFSCTGDTGHPFATYKLSATNPYATYTYNGASSKITTGFNFVPRLPFPNFADPFGNAITDKDVKTRLTYFPWPSTGGFIVPAVPAVANQVVSNAIKNNVASGLISSANPWKPKASLMQSVLELMSGDIPSITKNLRKHLYHLQDLKKTAGSDWLNVQFGWVPLINDIRATVEVLLKLHMLLLGSDNYRRARGGDLGTWSRMTDTTSDSGMSFGSPLAGGIYTSPYWKDYQNTGVPFLAPGNIPAGVGTWSRSTMIEADYRFTAKYHKGARANAIESRYIARATELLGLELTPAVLWELAPWTWLLDWVSNLGSLASNISLLDWSNVLLDYAYLTFVVKTTSQITWKGPTQWSSLASVSHGYISQSYTSEEKIREQASPYGFSVSWDGLSPFQLSILAALGMSRGR